MTPMTRYFGLEPAERGELDGCEILHQLIDGKHPIIYRVSTIRGAGFRNHPQ